MEWLPPSTREWWGRLLRKQSFLPSPPESTSPPEVFEVSVCEALHRTIRFHSFGRIGWSASVVLVVSHRFSPPPPEGRHEFSFELISGLRCTLPLSSFCSISFSVFFSSRYLFLGITGRGIFSSDPPFRSGFLACYPFRSLFHHSFYIPLILISDGCIFIIIL